MRANKNLNNGRTLLGNELNSKILFLIFILSIMLSGCSKDISITDEPLDFSGDILTWSSIQEIAQFIESQTIDVREESVNAYSLEECIQICEPITTSYDVYLKAKDGFMVKLDGKTISETYIAYVKGQGWSYISDKHPVNSGVKKINNIIIVTNINSENSEDKLLEDVDPDNYGLSLIFGDTNAYYTKGELLILNDTQFILEDGVTSLVDISISVLQQKQAVAFNTLVNKEYDKLLVYTFSGEEYYDYNKDGYIEVTKEQINYINNDLSVQKLNIVGIMIDPVGISNGNNYYDVQYYLEKNMKVMTILLDGFSYKQYEYIRDQNSDLILSNIQNVKKAKTVYKPVTNAGLASILSGVEPSLSGVLDRSFRELNVPTIFDYCEENNKSHGLIEGDINILNLNTKTYLNLDKDENGFTDNEIMDTVNEVMNENLDYTFIHFHSIDDCGHEYGPFANETLGQIKTIDEYLNEIINSFNGQIIITADHGMHIVGDHGDHGDFRFEDMFVPYIILSGGNHE